MGNLDSVGADADVDTEAAPNVDGVSTFTLQ